MKWCNDLSKYEFNSNFIIPDYNLHVTLQQILLTKRITKQIILFFWSSLQQEALKVIKVTNLQKIFTEKYNINTKGPPHIWEKFHKQAQTCYQ